MDRSRDLKDENHRLNQVIGVYSSPSKDINRIELAKSISNLNLTQ